MPRLCFIFLHEPWRSAVQLYTQIRESIDYYAPEADLYILPETLIGGLGIDATFLAEGVGGQTYNYMRLIASQIRTGIVAGLTIQDEPQHLYFRVFNFCEKPLLKFQVRESVLDDKYEFYQKRSCCFKCSDILCCVCCDLRFPVTHYTDEQFSALVYIGNSPAANYGIWADLLKIKSMEHDCPVVGCLRVGDDGIVNDVLRFDRPGQCSVLQPVDFKCFIDV